MTKKLAQNTVYLTMASIFQKVVAFVYFGAIAKYFGTELTGHYFTALAVITVVMVFNDVGITSVIIREVAKKTSDAVSWVRTMMGVKIVTVSITIGIAFIVPQLLGYGPEISQLIYIAVLVMIADTFSLSFYGILRGLQELKYESVGIFAGQIISASIGLFLIFTDQATLPLMVFALVAGSMWNMLFSAHFIRVKLGWKAFMPTWEMGLKPLQIAFAFFLAAVFVKVYSYVDTFILSKTVGSDAVGLYSVAYKLTYAFQFLPLAFVGALYPTMSAQAHEPEKLKKTLLSSFWYLSLLAAPIVFGIWSIAPELVQLYTSSEFARSADILMILIFVLIPIFLDFPLGALLNATDRQVIKTAIGGVTMIINVVGNLILIPRIGISGAAVTALISFSFMLFVDWIYVSRIIKMNIWSFLKEVLPIFLVGALMAAIVVLIKPYTSFVFAIPIGAVIYILGLVLIGSLNKGHLLAAKKLMRR